MIFRCYNGRLPAHALPLFGHVILPVRRYVVQHILQAVELVMVKHTDSVDGYLLRGNPAVGDVGLVHRAAAVRMNGGRRSPLPSVPWMGTVLPIGLGCSQPFG